MSAKRAGLSQYMGLVKSIRIDHLAYKQTLDSLEEGYASVGSSANPICLHIAGEYRTGKSCVIEDFLAKHPPERNSEGLTQSIVYVRLPSKATVKAVMERLLHAFGDPAWHRGSASGQTARLLDFLSKTRCRMIILDEFQHLCDKGQVAQLDVTTDWLKDLVEDKKWALVAAGLPESASVINRNRQLKGRFDSTLAMPLFDWRDASSRVQFRSIVRAFVAQMHPFELPDLGGDELGLRVFLATSGRVGLFAEIMDRVVRKAVRENTTKIRIQDLADAFQRAIWFAPSFPLPGGPFLGDLSHSEAELIEQVVNLAADDKAVHGNEEGTVRLQGVETSAQPFGQPANSRRKTSAKQKEELRRAL